MRNWFSNFMGQAYNHRMLTKKQNRTDYENDLLKRWDDEFGKINDNEGSVR